VANSIAYAFASQSLTTSYERLVLRINACIARSTAQLARRCRIERLQADCDDDWERVLDELRQVDGVTATLDPDGALLLIWKLPNAN